VVPITSRKYGYQVVEGWGKIPDWESCGTISAVACDAQDRVYVYTRGKHPLMIFDRDGNFTDSWGENIIREAHGMFIDGENYIYCTDRGAHCVYKFNSQGKIMMTLGEYGKTGKDGEPFNKPTDVAVAPTGEVFVSDGYGNRRVHMYSSDGRLLLSWGTQGDQPGQFALPHSVRIDKYGNVWVCDRENNRIQIFDANGNYLKEWNNLKRPDTLFFDSEADVVYIAELDFQVSIYTLDGELINQWGGGKKSNKPGEFVGWPHGIWADSHGDLYISEVNTEGRLQKFRRQG
jgi:DNA-binding beta-propeller fold protein YncE